MSPGPENRKRKRTNESSANAKVPDPEQGEQIPAASNKPIRKTRKFLTPSQVKAMSEWQEQMNTVAERDWHMFENEMYTDCTFSIGEGEKPTQVKCHRAYLAKTSPYFSTMFYGDMNETLEEVIHLPEVNLEAFRVMLRYVYLGKVDLDEYSYEVVCGVLHLTKMFLLPKIFRCQVRHFLWQNISPDNQWTAVEFAESNDEPKIEKIAWMLIADTAKYAIQQESFTEISKSTLINLVQRDDLVCTEDELFSACIRWSECEATRQGLDPEPSTLRELLSDVISHIRFLSMDKEKFAIDVVDTSILTLEETQPIFIYHAAGKLKNMSSQFCTKTNIRGEVKQTEFEVIGFPEGVDEIQEQLKVGKLHKCKTSGRLACAMVGCDNTTDSDILDFHGFQIPSQIKELSPNDSKEYEENLTIIAKDYITKKILAVKHYNKVVEYNSILDVAFDETFVFRGNRFRKACVFHVIFHQSGIYPAFKDTKEKGMMKFDQTFGDMSGVKCLYLDNFKFFHFAVFNYL